MIRYLTAEEILRLHFRIIEDFGGSRGVRDEGRIKSVIAAPKQTVFGGQQYPDIYEKAAVYMRNIIADHPFLDGNKRTGVTVGGVFLLRNRHKIIAPPKELENFAIKIAADHLDIEAISKWLKNHSEKTGP